MLQWTCTAHFGKVVKIQQLINSRSPLHFQSSKSSKIYQQQDHQSGVTISVIKMASHPDGQSSKSSKIYHQQDHHSGVTISVLKMASHPSLAKSSSSRTTSVGSPFQSQRWPGTVPHMGREVVQGVRLLPNTGLTSAPAHKRFHSCCYTQFTGAKY